MTIPVSGHFERSDGYVPTIVVDPAAVEIPGERRRQVVEAGLLKAFLNGTGFRQNVSATLMVVFAAFCWSGEGPVLLLAWLVAGLTVLLVRYWMERRFQRDPTCGDRTVRDAFVRSMLPVYGVHGGVWGTALLFSFDRLPLYDQMGSWLVLACAASAPLTSVALVPALQKTYTNTLFASLIAMAVASSMPKLSGNAFPQYMLLALAVAFWWLLNRFGRGIFRSQSEQLGLQYDLGVKEREARAAVETKDRFLAIAAHDMRQPVMALSLYAEYLVAYPEMQHELAPKIAATSQVVKNLFESLFDLASLDSGNVVLKVETVRAMDVLHSLGTQFGPLAAERGVRLRVRGIASTIDTDVVRLQRMIGNVLGNAIKYSPPGKKILLAFRRKGGCLRAQVVDQGLGIPADDLEKIFQEFYRVDRGAAPAVLGAADMPDAPAVEGVGLGLSIVMRLSRVLNTRLHVRSVVGRGTCFTFEVGNLRENAAGRTTALDVG